MDTAIFECFSSNSLASAPGALHAQVTEPATEVTASMDGMTLGDSEQSVMIRQPRIRAFTLIEIMVVVVLLGILAAIVFAQVSGATDSAKSSSLKSQLQTIRGQLELYHTQHAGNYPLLAQLNPNWGAMTAKTDMQGTVTALGA